METLKEITGWLVNLIWNTPKDLPFLVVILLGTGIFITFRLRWINIRKFIHGWEIISGKYDNIKDEGDINHFQALSAALSATVGIGNIAGVATAIHYGGPGALFWMWITAIFGMSLKYVEATLALKYRKVHSDGSVSGGPMYYIERGLGPRWKWLAVTFATLAVITSFGTGNSIQAFTVADQFRADLGIPTYITGFVMASLVALVIIGGIKRIGKVASRLAPAMAFLYVSGALLILIINYDRIPETFALIFSSAFQPAAEIGGFAGGTFAFMLTWGIKRGLFSNEAGQGSAPIAHAAAKTKEPAREGVVAMLGPFIDTLVICTMTGLVITVTGVWHDKKMDRVQVTPQAAIVVVTQNAKIETNGVIPDRFRFNGKTSVENGKAQGVKFIRNHSFVDNALILDGKIPYTGNLQVKNGSEIAIERNGKMESGGIYLEGKMAQNGSPLTSWAFQKGLKGIMGNKGNFIVTLAVFLFAISTAISWSYYGDRSIQYLLGDKAILPYKWVYVTMHFIGAIVSLEVVWGFGDAALGLMTLPNLIALIFLSGKVKEITQDYFSRKHLTVKEQLELEQKGRL